MLPAPLRSTNRRSLFGRGEPTCSGDASPGEESHCQFVETLTDLTCEVCGETFQMDANEQGWPTLPDAREFLTDHANCIAVVVTDD